NNVLLGCVSFAQNFPQVVQILRIANGHQDVARTHAQRFGRGLLVSVNAKLIQALGFPGTLPCHSAFRIREQCKKNEAKRNSTHRGLVLCEEIDQSSQKQYGGDQNYSQRQLSTAS